MKKVLGILFKTIFFLILIAISGLAILKIDKHAFLYVSFFWLVIIGLFVIKTNSEKKRLIAIYSGSAIVAFFIAELYFSDLLMSQNNDIKHEKHMIYGDESTEHEIFGFSPAKSSKWSEKLIVGDSPVYDIVQTVDDTGLRYNPAAANTENAILFFGGSFTFGAGVNDHETLPYYFQEASFGEFQAINLGGNGFGAHQTLAFLENPLEADFIKKTAPKAGVFSVITDHVFRGTGRLMESLGPRYKLNDQGEPIFQGTITEINKYSVMFNYEMGKSHLLKRFIFRRHAAKKEEIDLFVATLGKSRDLFIERYNVPFYCLLWDEKDSEPGLYDKLLSILNDEEFNVIEVKDILPGYEQDKSKYHLLYDGHPTAMANKLIAEYLAGLMRKKSLTDILEH